MILAQGDLPDKMHAALIERSLGGRIVGVIARDATEIEARDFKLLLPMKAARLLVFAGRSGRRSGWRGPELRDAEYLIDRECHHAEHEVAFDLDRAALRAVVVGTPSTALAKPLAKFIERGEFSLWSGRRRCRRGCCWGSGGRGGWRRRGSRNRKLHDQSQALPSRLRLSPLSPPSLRSILTDRRRPVRGRRQSPRFARSESTEYRTRLLAPVLDRSRIPTIRLKTRNLRGLRMRATIGRPLGSAAFLADSNPARNLPARPRPRGPKPRARHSRDHGSSRIAQC